MAHPSDQCGVSGVDCTSCFHGFLFRGRSYSFLYHVLPCIWPFAVGKLVSCLLSNLISSLISFLLFRFYREFTLAVAAKEASDSKPEIEPAESSSITTTKEKES